MKKIFLLLTVSTLIVFATVSADAFSLPWNIRKDMNILFVLKYSDKINFFAVRYSPSANSIKICFVDENIFVQSASKKKKMKPLKETFFETEENKQISVAKTEIERIFNGKMKFDSYVLFDDMFLKTLINIFSSQKDLHKNKNMLNILYSDEDRYNANVALIKIFESIYTNIDRWKIISLLKSFYKKDFVLETNFTLKDVLISYSSILEENKVLKYADIPVINKRNVLRADSLGVEKINNFLSDNNKYNDEKLRIEVLNTTGKSRLAIKAANKLRQNNFDVFDWGANSKKYLFSIIFDFVDNYNNCAKIKEILNCGEIIFRPEERDYTDISVQLGDDCIIYDKLDRQ
ncbi:MAG: LytR C-terminal domain-containing protein [Elusimicrobia bacterium]|nr:LytR C-terminal domain-containing protein [Elusimicrobiota bacterium]